MPTIEPIAAHGRATTNDDGDEPLARKKSLWLKDPRFAKLAEIRQKARHNLKPDRGKANNQAAVKLSDQISSTDDADPARPEGAAIIW
ncbi:hypothetical protein [Mesorhizobium kowhaii]|uniref:Uncharacterized protein n=1 Tax=Mesorhizobium kowhaii TaxID=1300272 RepID=A0A2W7BZT4_9HYPH|nr:hypothetical protein [Mesorhizobium kowhaii]PZV36282.1 hypothetical protein B5V02_24155 [Mesorhizobium kowhaii]